MDGRRIQVLPDAVANRIAAGEVVERPASVVKELVENAVDAGAGRVAVTLGDAGRSLIEVVDDGEGMGREDAVLALERHATSKIRADSDLLHIHTLGFRGEALPSIASVSRFVLTSRPEGAAHGTRIEVAGGKLGEVEEVGAARGTAVRVTDLFYNVPARRKFLKSDATELRHCVELVSQLALVHFDLGFELRTERRSLLAVPPGQSREERSADLVGAEVAGALYWHSVTREAGEVCFGFSAPHEGRGQRKGVRLFVNDRPVQDRMLLRALLEGYRGLLERQRYPVALLWLQVPAEAVDVNVHPAKREVRFRNERAVFGLVAGAVGEALAAAPWLAAGSATGSAAVDDGVAPAPWSPAQEPAEEALPTPAPRAGVRESLRRYGARMGAAAAGAGPAAPPAAAGRGGAAPAATAARVTVGGRARFQPGKLLGELPPSPPAETEASVGGQPAEPPAAPGAIFARLRFLAAFDATYLLLQDDAARELVLIDQHAAHERIWYERLLAASEGGAAARQPLLLPVVLECSPAELAALEVVAGLLEELGFETERFGPSSVAVTVAPAGFDGAAVEPLVRDLLSGEEVYSTAAKSRELKEEALRRAACSAAVKAGRALDASEVSALLQSLATLRNPTHCPHGRPLLVRLRRRDVAALFHRS